MCGFVAVISPHKAIDAASLDTMRDRLLHRGPDNGASWISDDGKVGFGHRRLSIIDRSHGADQPMATPDGQVVIAFNGEIYNYIELREELKAAGQAFTTQSDTEVLIAAYLQWGHACLPRLNGMFTFAIWDSRVQELFVARDRFGEKPLFMARSEGGLLAFASEMKAILAHPDIRVAACEDALAQYAKGPWYEDSELTFFKGVLRMPHATAFKFDVQGRELARWRYWTPDYEAVDEKISEKEAEAEFERLLKRSITMRLRADVPVGSSLSGGLDSSAVVGLLAQERSKQAFDQRTFSACFDEDPTMSETPFIQSVVDYTGVQSYRVNPTPEGLMAESARLHWHQEEPFLSASIYLQWCVARLANQNDTTVLLDGQGADELLAGYQFWYKLHQLDLLDEGQIIGAMQESWHFTRRLKKAAKKYKDSARRFNAGVAYSLKQLLALKLRPPGVWHLPYEAGVPKPVPGMRLKRTLAEALQYNSLPMLLRYADRNAMAFSRESRMPFLDYDLVDFCITLPSRHLVKNGWQKWILRRATKNVIPDDVRWRADKVGYAAPLDLWLRGALKDWAHARIFSPLLEPIAGYDRPALVKLWDEHQAGQNHSWALWKWISLTEWLQLLNSGVWQKGMPA